MCFKKNGVSYSIWLIFIMCNCAAFSFLGMLCARLFTDSFPLVGMGLIAAFFALLFLIYILTGVLTKRINKRIDEGRNAKADSVKKRLIIEGVLVIMLLVLGVGIRIHMLPMAGESAAYYDIAKVSQDSTAMLVPVQSSVYYYLWLLRGMFLLLGNHWIAGIWLQIVLQILSAAVFYFVVRKMGGVFAATAVLAYTMFSPSMISSGLNYSPQMLYTLFWSLGMLCVMLYLNGSTKGGEKEQIGYCVGMWLTVILLGIIIGFLSYVDVSGSVLVIPVLMLPMVYRESGKKAVWIGRMLLGVLAAAGGFFGSIYLDGVLSNASFMRILNAWIITFHFEMPDMVALLQNSTLEVIILLIIMAVNVFSFYRRKTTEVITVWVLMTFAMAVLYVLGLTTESMNDRPMLLLLMSVVAAVGVRELFAINAAAEEKIPAEEGIQIIELDNRESANAGSFANQESFVKQTSSAEQCDSEKQDSVEKPQKPRFLENPLPLPKKHVKKTMDYAFVPEVSKMNYDVEVKEGDDFDV